MRFALVVLVACASTAKPPPNAPGRVLDDDFLQSLVAWLAARAR